MKVIEMKLSEITPYGNNPRKNDDAVEVVAKSIKQFGFLVPIVIDKNKIIVAGDTRYKAAVKIGYEKAPCIMADELTEEQVRAFRLADNKVAETAEWDTQRLLEELDEIVEIDMECFGFECEKELEALDLEDTSSESANGATHTCPKCGFEFEV